MKNEDSIIKQLYNYLPLWVEDQKRKPLKLKIYRGKNNSKIKIYLSPLKLPQKYFIEESLLKRVRILRGTNVLLIDEIIDNQLYTQLETALSSISKIQGISKAQSLAFILQVYLLIIDFSREKKNNTPFLKELRELMLEEKLLNKKPIFKMNNILELWLSMGALFLDGLTYHPDSFRIHCIYMIIPPIWLTDTEYKNLNKGKYLEIKKPIYTGTEFYPEIKQKIPNIEKDLRKVYRINDKRNIDSKIENSIGNNIPYMNIQECAEYTRIKKNSLYQLTSKRKIPHSKLGKTLIFKKEDIDKWIADPERKILTDKEIENLEKDKGKKRRKRSARRISDNE